MVGSVVTSAVWVSVVVEFVLLQAVRDRDAARMRTFATYFFVIFCFLSYFEFSVCIIF